MLRLQNHDFYAIISSSSPQATGAPHDPHVLSRELAVRSVLRHASSPVLSADPGHWLGSAVRKGTVPLAKSRRCHHHPAGQCLAELATPQGHHRRYCPLMTRHAAALVREPIPALTGAAFDFKHHVQTPNSSSSHDRRTSCSGRSLCTFRFHPSPNRPGRAWRCRGILRVYDVSILDPRLRGDD